MCGIAGFCGRGDMAVLEAMTALLAHRGPDGEGYHADTEAGVFLGHRRLAILDAAHGEQPMWSADGDIAIVYNGEIYNHLELRAELERAGHRFRTSHCDTEVLIHGYRAWGEELPTRLNGMFAFAIYHKSHRTLFLARDRFGEKPLYYAEKSGFFAFASELDALARHPRVGSDISPAALRKYFAYGYLPAPHAFYAGCRKLPGGCRLCLNLDSGETRLSSYWRFTLSPNAELERADEDALAEELEALIAQAVRRRLMSDVPLGVFLSGGLDSSMIAASACAASAEDVSTFTIGFTEKSFDEAPFARTVATHLRTAHHEQTLDLEMARDLIPTVLGGLDEPLGDASILPTYLLSRFVREHVIVALSGDGGDELFAGYDPFKALEAARIYQAVTPRAVHRGLRRLADLLPFSHKNMSFDFKLRRALMGLSYPAQIRLPVWMAPLEPCDLAELMETPVDPQDVYSEAAEAWEEVPELTDVDRALIFFTRFYLQDDILAKVDRATMAHSLESRAVFLDNDVVAFCQKLPTRFKYHRGERKRLLKRAARRALPREIIDRKKKGFGIPLAAWLKTMPPEPPLQPVTGLNTGMAARAFASHRAGEADHRLFLWSWLSLQSCLHRQEKVVP